MSMTDQQIATQSAIQLLESQGYLVTPPWDRAREIQHLQQRLAELDRDLFEPRWGIQDDDAIEVERAAKAEQRVHMQRNLNRLLRESESIRKASSR